MCLRAGIRYVSELDGTVCSVEAQEKTERFENGGDRCSSKGDHVTGKLVLSGKEAFTGRAAPFS